METPRRGRITTRRGRAASVQRERAPEGPPAAALGGVAADPNEEKELALIARARAASQEANCESPRSRGRSLSSSGEVSSSGSPIRAYNPLGRIKLLEPHARPPPQVSEATSTPNPLRHEGDDSSPPVPSWKAAWKASESMLRDRASPSSTEESDVSETDDSTTASHLPPRSTTRARVEPLVLPSDADAFDQCDDTDRATSYSNTFGWQSERAACR